MTVGVVEVAQRSNHQVRVLESMFWRNTPWAWPASLTGRSTPTASPDNRRIEVQLEFAFGFVERLVDVFQQADEQVFLAAERVIKHAVVGVGLLGGVSKRLAQRSGREI